MEIQPSSVQMKPPLGVVFLGCLFIAAGGVGLVYHLSERPVGLGTLFIAAIRVLAIVGGIYLIKGRNWARWTMLAWVAFHVFVGALHSVSNSLAHVALLLVIGYFLLTPPASKYFQSPTSE